MPQTVGAGLGVGSGREGVVLQSTKLQPTQLQPKAVGEGEKPVKPDEHGFKSRLSLTSNANPPVSLPQHFRL